jgi:hypothetical protein
MPITRIRKRVVREVFAPAMRLFRDTLQESGDVGAIRDWAARLDRALFHDETGGLWQVVALQHCAASWFMLPPNRQPVRAASSSTCMAAPSSSRRRGCTAPSSPGWRGLPRLPR